MTNHALTPRPGTRSALRLSNCSRTILSDHVGRAAPVSLDFLLEEGVPNHISDDIINEIEAARVAVAHNGESTKEDRVRAREGLS